MEPAPRAELHYYLDRAILPPYQYLRCHVPPQVLSHLLMMLEVTSGAAAPSGDEATRILAFFLSSLQNPTLVRPPPVETMMSFNTLTPHYEEDVIYALSAGDTAKQLGLGGSAAQNVRAPTP